MRAAAHSVDCKIDWLWIRSPFEEKKYLLKIYIFHFFALVSRQNAALSSATQHAMHPEVGGKWGTECLNTRFPLPTLLCAGYSVNLIYLFFLKIIPTSKHKAVGKMRKSRKLIRHVVRAVILIKYL